MVDSHIAGVLFTANPVTGWRHQAVIDASPGLGEAVVSGAVNPDPFVVDTSSGEILERRLGDKRLMIRSLSGGGTEHVSLSPDAHQSCLTDAQIRDLAALGQRVESLYGAPQDTEWALALLVCQILRLHLAHTAQTDEQAAREAQGPVAGRDVDGRLVYLQAHLLGSEPLSGHFHVEVRGG
jgi:phosphoenolpyruvate synthase/pyruvate phosphate dikinase